MAKKRKVIHLCSDIAMVGGTPKIVLRIRDALDQNVYVGKNGGIANKGTKIVWKLDPDEPWLFTLNSFKLKSTTPIQGADELDDTSVKSGGKTLVLNVINKQSAANIKYDYSITVEHEDDANIKLELDPSITNLGVEV